MSVGLFVGLSCSNVVVLSPQEQADVVASAIDVPGGDRIPGPPPPENDDAEHIQIRHLTAPALLQPGQAFVIHVQTDVEDPDRVSGAALAVQDAPDHILVSSLPPLRQIFKGGGEVWWGLDLPARFGETDSGLTQENFEFRLALLDENGEAGNYFAWTVWAGEEGPTCPDDASCGSQECGVDPVCGTPCGLDDGGCGGGGICEFYGTCVAPEPVVPDTECLDSCNEQGFACGINPAVPDCVCPSTCEADTECQVNDCVGPASDCMSPEDCEPNEDCMDGSCNRISCSDRLPCPPGTGCVNDFCEVGCSFDDPDSCPPGSECQVDGSCQPQSCDPETGEFCPLGSFCDESQSCQAHNCDLANPQLGCTDGDVCRVQANLDAGGIVAPAICQAPGDVPTDGLCTSNPADASHDCNADDVCWNPSADAGAPPRCIERCLGPNMAQCSGGRVCDPVVPGLLHICLQPCDPLGASPCSNPDDVCVPTRHRDYDPPLDGFDPTMADFVCKPHGAAGGTPHAVGESCDEPNECALGLTCAGSLTDCGGPGSCCLPFCIEDVDCGSGSLLCSEPLDYPGNTAVGECSGG